MDKILVLGSTGNIGWPLVKIQHQRTDCTVVAGVCHHVPQPMQDLGVATVHFDFLAPSTFAPALAGVTKVFFVRPPQLANPEQDMRPFLETVKEHGIAQVVFISLMGVEKNPIVPHRKIEQMITTLGLPHTFIRPSFFMQNLCTTHLADIQQHHDLFIPAGRAKTSFIDTEDIAAVAAAALTDPQYLGQALTITGPAAITYDHVAQIMSETLGVPITYSHPGLLQFRRAMIRRGVKKEFVNVMVMLYVITRLGNAKGVTDTVQQVLQRPARTVAQFVQANAALFLE